jgi:hypothetical protein
MDFCSADFNTYGNFKYFDKNLKENPLNTGIFPQLDCGNEIEKEDELDRVNKTQNYFKCAKISSNRKSCTTYLVNFINFLLHFCLIETRINKFLVRS